MKLAVIGTGWIVKSFIDGLKFAPDFELFAVYSRSHERGEKFAKENGIEEVYETSAKTGFNAKNIFCRAAQILYKEHLNYKQIGRDPSLIRVGTEDLDPTTIPIPKEQKKKGCC